jgi:hypothetical protein
MNRYHKMDNLINRLKNKIKSPNDSTKNEETISRGNLFQEAYSFRENIDKLVNKLKDKQNKQNKKDKHKHKNESIQSNQSNQSNQLNQSMCPFNDNKKIVEKVYQETIIIDIDVIIVSSIFICICLIVYWLIG